MRSRLPDGAVFAVLIGALLLLGLLSLQLIPAYEPLWGLDFQNVYAFQTCPGVEDLGPYGLTGQECADELGRAFVYPPAMFYVFAWVGLLTFDVAVVTWNVAMVVVMLLVGWLWWKLDSQQDPRWLRPAILAIWLALLIQYPFVFALERGNNDVLPLLAWSLAAFAYIRGKPFLAGTMAGIAVGLKVYPAVALFVILVGVIRSRRQDLPGVGLGVLAGLAMTTAFWWNQTIEYVTTVLPEFAGQTWPPSIYNHPIRGLDLPPAMTFTIAGVLLIAWLVASWTRFAQAPALVLAGSLAISTYFSSTSWDYNLITVYPTILLAILMAYQSERSSLWKIGAFATVITIVAGRGLFPPQIQTLLGVASLTFLAVVLVLDTRADGSVERPVTA